MAAPTTPDIIPSTASLAPLTRLYISPLNPSFLATILPGTVQPPPTNISYHSIATFPENTYGYVELPAEAAQKLKKKLNGFFLKGMKVRVEEARPDKKRKAAEQRVEAAGEDVGEEVVERKRAKKEKRRDGVMPAVELPEGREVKRGWVQPTSGEKQEKKRRSGGKEGKVEEKSPMIFRTSLPPNVASNAVTTGGKKEKSGKERKGKKEGKSKEIKEFSKSTKYPTFLRDSQVSNVGKATSFVDGQGWVDEDGNVVEAVGGRASRRAAAKAHVESNAPEEEDEQPAPEREKEPASEEDSSSTPGEAEREGTPDTQDDAAKKTEDSPARPDMSKYDEPNDSRHTSAAPPTPEHDSISPAVTTKTTSPPKEIHPLEALYKRPRPSNNSGDTPSKATNRPAPIVTNFSFFDSDADGVDAEQEDGEDVQSSMLVPPQTPFTRRDLESRGMRSAAPTPDTAAVGKRGTPWHVEADDDDEEEEEEVGEEETHDDADVEDSLVGHAPVGLGLEFGEASNAAQGAEGETEQTDFEKHFWAHRGEYNRGWKARKREARKEARQSGNRSGGGGGGAL